ncbi:uncharacterized protein LOC121380034 [Gigantopelta aegis]|uniref:uncharacterized protein LOC121380034 n=1 Tax=Gigantopelta aegis TaxID=1735272 RepID=UPI001B888A8A|nr:uncharacterized protein LOC121380034 [Gigantopelta aegis]
MLSLVGVLCLSTVLLAHPCEREKRAAGCEFQGQNYDDGQVFTIALSGPCIKYTCNAGSTAPSTIECKADDGSCVPFGTTKTSMCRVSKCGQNAAGSIGFHPVEGSNYECQDKDGKCGYHDGDKVTRMIGNAAYSCTCRLEGNTISYEACSSMP